jgi:hypothetical protein
VTEEPTPIPFAVTPDPDRTGPSVSIAVARRVTRTALLIRLGCPPEEDVCIGSASAGGDGTSFRTRGGRVINVRPRLNRSALRVLRRRGTVRLRIRVEVSDRAGNADVTQLVVRARRAGS